MPKVVYRHPDGAETVLDGATGESVMTLAIQNGLDGIIGECGGSCACATCHVYVSESFLGSLADMDELESDMLEGAACERKHNSRLSCQVLLAESLDGLVVELPRSQL